MLKKDKGHVTSRGFSLAFRHGLSLVFEAAMTLAKAQVVWSNQSLEAARSLLRKVYKDKANSLTTRAMAIETKTNMSEYVIDQTSNPGLEGS